MNFTKFGRAIGGAERDIKKAEQYINGSARDYPSVQLACVSYESALLEVDISSKYVKTERQRERYDRTVNRLVQLQKSLVEYGVQTAERELTGAQKEITSAERRAKDAQELGLPATRHYGVARSMVLSAETSVTPLLKTPGIGDNESYVGSLVQVVDKIISLRKLLENKKAAAE